MKSIEIAEEPVGEEDVAPEGWRTAVRTAERVQGWVYVGGGLWPVVNIRSFEWITGPKADRWLVKTVGLLLTAIGVTELVASSRDEPPGDSAYLGVGSALGLLAIDLVYVAKRRISPIYLLDAGLQVVLLGLWGRSLRRRSSS